MRRVPPHIQLDSFFVSSFKNKFHIVAQEFITDFFGLLKIIGLEHESFPHQTPDAIKHTIVLNIGRDQLSIDVKLSVFNLHSPKRSTKIFQRDKYLVLAILGWIMGYNRFKLFLEFYISVEYLVLSLLALDEINQSCYTTGANNIVESIVLVPNPRPYTW